MRASTIQWSDVDRLVLDATRQPVTVRQVADCTGLTPDLAQAQLEVLQRDGLLSQTIDAGVRYQLTLTGWKRLSALLDKPGTQAAA